MATKEGNRQGGTRNRGFASMDPERQRQIASEGGKAAHEKGTAHEFTSEEARRAGSLSHGNRQAAESSTRTGSSRQSARKDEGSAREEGCLLYTSPSPRDRQKSRMPSSA